MRTTKHITNLAQKIADEPKDSKYRESQIKYFTDELTRIKNALLNGRFYCGVVSVSRSGMSRKIKIGYIYKGELNIIHNPRILKLAGINKNGNISGCGMDMLFHSQYTLFHNLHTSYKKAYYQRRMKRYRELI